MYTLYAYWNGEQVRTVLTAIALIMNGGDYLGLIKALSIVGILVAAGTAMVRMRGEEPLGYFIMFALFYGTLFVPKTTVTVQDLRTASVYTVANVPLGVAFFASETSHIGKWLTESFETNFTPVDDVKFEKNGMAFGARIIEQLQSVKVRTPSLQQDLIAFVKDCVNPELLDNPTALNDMVKSTDLWGFIGGSGSFELNPGRATTVSGVAMTCGATNTGAYKQLTLALANEATERAKDIAALANPGNPGAQALIAAQIPAIEGLMLNVSRTAQESIKQGMVMNMMRDSQSAVAQLQGNPQAAQIALAVAMAEQSSSVSYAAMAKVAQGALPKLRNAIELIVIALFPVVFILVVLSGIKAGLVMRSYVMAMLWVQLWAPLYAVINFMATKSDSADLLGILRGTAGNTMENMGQLADMALSNQSIAGLLTISVPLIAYALVKGGEVAMSSVASSIMSPAQGSAQKVGDAVGQGNVNAGNVSWGTTSANNVNAGNWGSGNASFNNAGANKQDLSSARTDPQTSTTSTPWGSYTTDGKGAVTGMQASQWSVGGGVGGGTTMNRSDMASSGDTTRATTGRSATLDLSSAATSGNRSSADFARQLTTALASGMGTNGQWGQSWNAGTSGSASTETSGQSSLQNQDSFRWGSRVAAGSSVAASKMYGPYDDGASGAGQPGGGQPAGGAGQGPGNGNHAAQAASGGSGKSLPVPAGEVPRAGSKAGPTMGRLAQSFDAGTGADASTAQALIDMATNKNGSQSQKSMAHAAQVVMSGVNSVMQSTNDAGVRAAGQSFAADFQKAVRAGEQQSAGVQHDRSAGSTQQQGTQNQVGGSMSIGAPVAQQLLAMAGGDPVRALQLAGNPQAVAQATQSAAAQMKESNGGAFLGAGGAHGPAAQADVAAQGNADVNRLSGQSKAAAGRADGANRHAVAGHQAANPTSSPDTSPASAGFGATSGGAYAAYQALSGDTAFSKGATDVAAALYKDNQQGVGTVLANSFAFGAGYKSPQEYQQALTAAAASSPKLASTLKQIGNSGGGKVSPQAMEYIQSELKSFQDSQPGFFSKLVDGVMGR